MPAIPTTCLACAVLILLLGCKPPQIMVTETKIKVVQDTPGRGDPVSDGDGVLVNYYVNLPDGRRVIDGEDYQFEVGTDSVIRGIDEAIRGMRAGGSRTFICPPHKHWGRAGYANGKIPPATDLTVRLELLRVNRAGR